MRGCTRNFRQVSRRTRTSVGGEETAAAVEAAAAAGDRLSLDRRRRGEDTFENPPRQNYVSDVSRQLLVSGVSIHIYVHIMALLIDEESGKFGGRG